MNCFLWLSISNKAVWVTLGYVFVLRWLHCYDSLVKSQLFIIFLMPLFLANTLYFILIDVNFDIKVKIKTLLQHVAHRFSTFSFIQVITAVTWILIFIWKCCGVYVIFKLRFPCLCNTFVACRMMLLCSTHTT